MMVAHEVAWWLSVPNVNRAELFNSHYEHGSILIGCAMLCNSWSQVLSSVHCLCTHFRASGCSIQSVLTCSSWHGGGHTCKRRRSGNGGRRRSLWRKGNTFCWSCIYRCSSHVSCTSACQGFSILTQSRLLAPVLHVKLAFSIEAFGTCVRAIQFCMYARVQPL